MPYRGLKVVVVTPAGRRRYLELLIPQVLGFGVVDEYQLWVNTDDKHDIAYMESVQSDIVKLVTLPEGATKEKGNLRICKFFMKCIDPNTIYVRFDDDIVLLDTKAAFLNFLDFRIDNPNFFLVYGCILNNAMVSHILQRAMKLDTSHGVASYNCLCPVGWGNGDFAKNIHNQIAQKNFDLSKFRLECNWVLHENERVSINCISWVGSRFNEVCGGKVGDDEELELASLIPKAKNIHNVIFGGFCCVHFAFHTQRDVVDPILHIYSKSCTNSAKLVVAKFKEDVSWLSNIKIPYVVYDKSNGMYPNIGREAETYLRYIVDNYENLPDLSIFVQGNPFDHINMSNDAFIEKVNACDCTVYDDYYALNDLITEVSGCNDSPAYDVVYQSMKEFLHLSKISISYPSGAQFILPKKCILYHHKSFYTNLHLKMLKSDVSSMGSSNVCPWTIERMWPYIFTKF